MQRHVYLQSPDKQTGVVLIVALIMLMAMTVLSVSSMTGSTIEERMASNLRDRETALQAAEATLRFGERLAEQANANPAVFNSTCNGGYCSNVIATAADAHHWKDSAVWADTNRHITFTTSPEAADDSKLIIEHMGIRIEGTDGSGNPIGPNIYRITAIGIGQTTNAQVMLQSTYIPFN